MASYLCRKKLLLILVLIVIKLIKSFSSRLYDVTQNKLRHDAIYDWIQKKIKKKSHSVVLSFVSTGADWPATFKAKH